MLLTLKRDDLNSVKDLKKKKIMITEDAAASASILAMIFSQSLSTNDFIAQKHSFNIEDLINGNTDAMSSYISNEPFELEKRGIEYNILSPKDYGFDFYSDILFTSTKYINANPRITKDFLDASLKGWKYAFNNIHETAKIIYDKFNTQNKSLEHLIREGNVLKSLAYDKNGFIGSVDKKRLIDIASTFKVLTIMQDNLDVESFIYKDNPHYKDSFEFTSNEQKIILVIVFGIVLLITLLTFLIKKIKKSKDLLDTVINATTDFIFYKDKDFKYIGCNKSFQKFVNKNSKEIVGYDDFDIFNEKNAQSFRAHDIATLKENKERIFEEWVEINNKRVLLQIRKIPFIYSSQNKKGIVGVSRDITKMYEINMKLKEQTYIDELTSCFNRKSYNEKIEENIELFHRYNTNFCSMLFDIDNFKLVNDNYGHDIGDKVLVNLTKIVGSTIRKTDILFRIGGEEFIVIFQETDLNNAIIATEKIRNKIENSHFIDNKTITISAGVTKMINDDTADSIFKRVDDLLYEAKNKGKNKTCHC